MRRIERGDPDALRRTGDDAWTFARAIMLNWIIGGTDAHAKNFSMLIGAAGRARLAPLYDMASTLPYGFDPMKLKMATRIGGKYRWKRSVHAIGRPSQHMYACRPLKSSPWEYPWPKRFRRRVAGQWLTLGPMGSTTQFCRV